ncbi:MAG TPA: alginate export family protein [Acidobacteriota bacterium]|nr:alginate export family protein [Acidobacteriota bacterium]
MPNQLLPLILTLALVTGPSHALNKELPTSTENENREGLTNSRSGCPEQKPPADAVARPAYRNLRFEEDWSLLDSTSTTDFFDQLKHIPLGPEPGEKVFLSLGGQIRTRGEAWSNFGFGAGSSYRDGLGLLRVRLHSDWHFGPRARVFVEGMSALATGRSLPGSLRTLDVDSADIKNAFLDIVPMGAGSKKLTLRAGRQELEFGRQRLVSPLDWSNTRPRSFDGIQAIYQTGDLKISSFWSKHVRTRKYRLNSSDDSKTDFFGIYFSGATLRRPGPTLDLYWLGLRRASAVFSGVAGKEVRHTFSGRVSGPGLQGRFSYDLEAALQTGEHVNREIRAFMVAALASYQPEELPSWMTLATGVDFATGDHDPSDNRLETFNQLFPLGHAYLGFIDIVGRQNVLDWHQKLAAAPLKRWSFSTDFHNFWRASGSDALYDAGSGLVRAGGQEDPRYVGFEVDLMSRYALDRHTILEIGYSHFFPGSFIEETGSDKDIDFGYLSMQYTW